jgi:gluconokinase
MADTKAHAAPVPLAVVVMGVAGSGKSTVGVGLSVELAADFIDADDMHPASNKKKMSDGIPLDDEDRLPWLRAVGAAIRSENESGRSVVVACSALKRRYRDLLRESNRGLAFVHLDGAKDVLAERLEARLGHFMLATMLDSQLATLEPLQADEKGVTLNISDNPTSLMNSAAAAIRLG